MASSRNVPVFSGWPGPLPLLFHPQSSVYFSVWHWQSPQTYWDLARIGCSFIKDLEPTTMLTEWRCTSWVRRSFFAILSRLRRSRHRKSSSLIIPSIIFLWQISKYVRFSAAGWRRRQWYGLVRKVTEWKRTLGRVKGKHFIFYKNDANDAFADLNSGLISSAFSPVFITLNLAESFC